MMQKKTTNRLLLLSLIFFIVSSGLSLIFSTQLSSIANILTLASSPAKNGTPIGTTGTSVAGSDKATQTPEAEATSIAEQPVQPTTGPKGTPTNISPDSSLFDTFPNSIVMSDTFDRKDQVYWGESTNIVDWEGDGRNNPDFQVKGKHGLINGTNFAYTAFYKTTDNSNYVVELTASLNNVTGNNSIGIVIRLQNEKDWKNNWYFMRIANGKISIEINQNGRMRTIVEKQMTMVKDQVYIIQAAAVNEFLALLVWPKDKPAEAKNIFTADNTFKKGYCGLHTTLSQGSVATIYKYDAGGVWSSFR